MNRLTKDVAIIAAATAVSRVFGLFRDVVIADKFGAGTAYDAYIIAFFVPHFLRRLLAEGALALSFIPIFSQYLERDKRQADLLASNTLNLLLVLFPVLIVLGILFAPHFIPFLASGFSPSQLELTVDLTRIVFPFIGFIGLAALVMGVLNAKKHFFAPAFAPVFFNVGVIAGALFLGGWFDRLIFGLASGVLLGGLGQLLFQLPFLRGRGFNWSAKLFPLHPGLKKAGRLMIPVVVGLIAVQINILVDNKLASYLAEGSISSLQYGTRLFQLPLGLFAVAISTAILPRLSGLWARDKREEFGGTLRRGIQLSFFIILPATLGLFLLGRPIVELLFEHNQFTPADTVRTVRILNYYLIGLVGYSFVQLFTRAFYSVQETITPVIAGVVAVGVNVGLDLALVGLMDANGLALATAVSGVVNGLLLWGLFKVRTDVEGFLPPPGLVAKIVAATGAMGGIVWGVYRVLREFTPNEFFLVFVPVLVGIGSYFLFSKWMGTDDLLLDEF